MWNKDEELYYAANLLFQCRCDWSDAEQIRDWCETARNYLPPNLADFIDEEYIYYTQQDGRNARDSFPSYSQTWALVNLDNLSLEFKEYIQKEYEWFLSLKKEE